MVDDAAGRRAVEVAREAIARALGTDPPLDPALPYRRVDAPPVFDEPRGVFVTLRRWPGGALRGCIGIPVPVYPLRVGLPRAAVSAATEDPRFPSVSTRELPETTVEVSILTPPEPLDVANPRDRPKAVRVGTDGLMVEGEGTSGLLLPQVAVEEGWDATTFLAQTCVKAGLRPDAWRSDRVRFRRFQAEVFGEGRPGGPSERRLG